MSEAPHDLKYNTTTYRSKIDAWLVLVLIPAMAASACVALMSLTSNPLVPWTFSVLIALTGVALPLSLLVATYYRIEARALSIRSGPFTWRVPLAEISKVTPTYSPWSSPALSLDRLRIDYGHGRWIMISPRDKEGFLRELEARRVASTTRSGH